MWILLILLGLGLGFFFLLVLGGGIVAFFYFSHTAPTTPVASAPVEAPGNVPPVMQPEPQPALQPIQPAPQEQAAGAGKDALPLKELKAATVYIKVRTPTMGSSGSGLVVHAQGSTVYLATNHHVIDPKPERDNTDPPPPFVPQMPQFPFGPRIPIGPRFPMGPRFPRRGMSMEGPPGAPVAGISVVFYSGTSKEQSLSATVVGDDAVNDLVILKAVGVRDVPRPIDYQRAPELHETMPVVAFGFPFGEELDLKKRNPAVTVTKGNIASLRGEGDQVEKVQLDLDVNPGNSGGPVVDEKGALIGVVKSKIVNTRIGFAIPVPKLKSLIQGRIDPPTMIESLTLGGRRQIRVRAAAADPLGKLRAPTLLYGLANEVRIPPRMNGNGWGPLIRAKSSPMILEGIQAVAALELAAPANGQLQIIAQVSYQNAEGQTVYGEPKTLSLNATNSPPAIAAPAQHPNSPPSQAPGRKPSTAERPVLPPIRPGPENRPPRIAADQVEKMLPSTIADVAVGGGGRYLVLHLPQEHKLAVFDVSEAKIKGYVPAAGSSVKFAAGREKLLVALGSENIIQRWNLATLEREVTAPLAMQYKLSLIAMGCNSNGPLLVASADGIWKAELFFMDIRTLKKLPIELTGDSHIHIMEGDGVRASADGRVFGLWSLWMGRRTLVLDGKEARGHHENGLSGHLIPGPDGKVIYTAKGRYTNQIKPLGSRSDDGPYCLPAVQGDYYLTVKANSPQGGDKCARGTLAVHVAGEERPLITLPEMDLPASIHGQAPNSQTLAADKRIYFIPAAKLIVLIPDSSDRLVLQRFDVMQALEKSGIDYLFVASQPPVKAKPGATYRYQLAVKSKKGGIKYRVESAPEGMKISDTGLLTWDVPRSASETEIDVILTIRDKTEQEIFLSFRILLGD